MGSIDLYLTRHEFANSFVLIHICPRGRSLPWRLSIKAHCWMFICPIFKWRRLLLGPESGSETITENGPADAVHLWCVHIWKIPDSYSDKLNNSVVIFTSSSDTCWYFVSLEKYLTNDKGGNILMNLAFILRSRK